MKKRIDFRQMPHYTRPEQYRQREYIREHGGFSGDPDDHEMDDAAPDPWGDDDAFWFSFGG